MLGTCTFGTFSALLLASFPGRVHTAWEQGYLVSCSPVSLHITELRIDTFRTLYCMRQIYGPDSDSGANVGSLIQGLFCPSVRLSICLSVSISDYPKHLEALVRLVGKTWWIVGGCWWIVPHDHWMISNSLFANTR